MADDGYSIETATLEQARRHARSLDVQARSTDAATGRSLPASAADDLPHDVPRDAVVWDETIPTGGYSARRLPRGSVLRVSDTVGDACLQLLVHNANHTAERLNVADTVKVQWQAYLGEGALLLSDMGRVLMTIVADASGRHDCLCGASNRRANQARYGDGSQSGPTPSGRDLLILAGLKHGLSLVDIGPNINLFKQVSVADDGALTLDGSPTAPVSTDLRAELDVIVLVANTPHVLDERAGYTGSPVRLTAWRPIATVTAAEDAFRTTTPERARAFLNTDDHLLEMVS